MFFISFLPYTFNLLQTSIEHFVQHKVNNLHLLEGDKQHQSIFQGLSSSYPRRPWEWDNFYETVSTSREEFSIVASAINQHTKWNEVLICTVQMNFTMAPLETEESCREVAKMGRKGCNDLYSFNGCNIFIFPKIFTLPCKYVQQSQYIDKTKTKQRPMLPSMNQYSSPFTIKMGFCFTIYQLLMNWPLSRGYFGS